jgi:GTP-binding protein
MLEPFEDVYIEVAEPYMGAVMEQLGARRGLLENMHHSEDGSVHMQYKIPTRGLLGFRSDFLTITRGTGVMHTLFSGYETLAGEINTREHGSLVAWEPGLTSNYGLKNGEERGTLFIGPGVNVYEGMVVGQHIRDTDLAVNVCKKKHLTNMRSSTADIQVRLTPPRVMSLDDSIEYLGPDELLEVTPQNLRIRKRILNTEERRKLARREDKEREEREAER